MILKQSEWNYCTLIKSESENLKKKKELVAYNTATK